MLNRSNTNNAETKRQEILKILNRYPILDCIRWILILVLYTPILIFIKVENPSIQFYLFKHKINRAKVYFLNKI